jgi:hypothetical protein
MVLEGTVQVVIAWDWYSANTSTLPTTSRDQNKQDRTTSAPITQGYREEVDGA